MHSLDSKNWFPWSVTPETLGTFTRKTECTAIAWSVVKINRVFILISLAIFVTKPVTDTNWLLIMAISLFFLLGQNNTL